MASSRTAASFAMLILVSLCNSSAAARVKTMQSQAETSKNSHQWKLAGFEVTKRYKCIFPTCNDFWCDANCNHVPKYCPKTFCQEKAVPPPAEPPLPPPSEAINKPGKPGNMCVKASTNNRAKAEEKGNPMYFCCHQECGTCGGVGCSKRGPWYIAKEDRQSKSNPEGVSKDDVLAGRAKSVANCCVKQIKESKKSCGGDGPGNLTGLELFDGKLIVGLPPCVVYSDPTSAIDDVDEDADDNDNNSGDDEDGENDD